MANDNGNEGEKVKKCPFLGDWCLGEACAIRAKVVRNVGGLQQQASMCPVDAVLAILSEINAKTASPQQKIEIPNLFKG